MHGAHTADLQRALSLGFMAALSLEVAKAGLQVIVLFENALLTSEVHLQLFEAKYVSCHEKGFPFEFHPSS